MIAHEYDQHAIKSIIGRCDFFIGSRMHACIAALSQKIPTAAVAIVKNSRECSTPLMWAILSLTPEKRKHKKPST